MRYGYKAVSRALRAAGWTGLLLVVPATAVRAQTSSPAPATRTIQGPGAGRWGVGLTAQQAWARTSAFSTFATQDRFVTNLDLSLYHNDRLGKGQWSISAGGVALRDYYTDQNILTYSGSLNLGYPLSRSINANVAGSSTYAYARELAVLADAGVVLPLELTRTNAAGGGLNWRASPSVSAAMDVRYDNVNYTTRDTDVAVASIGGSVAWRASLKTAVTLDGRYDRVDFTANTANDAISPGSTTAFGVDGANIIAGAGVSRQISRGSGLSLRYGFQRSTTLGARQGDTHSVAGGWNWSVSPKVTVNLSGGASHYEVGQSGASGWTPNAGAGLTARFTDSLLSLRYSRAITPSYGYGRNLISDQFSASYNRAFGRRVVASGAAGYGIRHDPTDQGFDLKTTTVSTDLRYVISRSFSFNGGYQYRHTSREGPFARPTTHVGTASLTYGYEWR